MHLLDKVLSHRINLALEGFPGDPDGCPDQQATSHSTLHLS